MAVRALTAAPDPSPRWVVSSRPSWPLLFNPQHLTVPSSNRAHVKFSPAATWRAVLPAGKVIALRLVISPEPSPIFEVFPCPNCPNPLYPQHFIVLSSNRAQVWSPPVVISTAFLLAPRLISVRFDPISPEPSPISLELSIPNCPNSLSPQHLTELLSNRTQEWFFPTATSTTLPSKSIADRLLPISDDASPILLVFPCPNCPESFLPQHLTELYPKLTQEW